jgi:heme oxygenase
MSAIALLRSETAAAHERVDSAFGAYDLGARDSYCLFLAAHARALPQAESMAAAVWPSLRRRTPLLAADLAALGHPVDLAVTTAMECGPAQWGALYVVEGSRLGGGMLAKRVPADWPHAYLSAVHEPGEWRAIRSAIDSAAEGQGRAWLDAMLAGARQTFASYEAAVVVPTGA